MGAMTTQEIRASYLKFMAGHGHVIVPRANLVPQDDPTTLFTNSGMQPILPYLLGAVHPEGTRITDSQRVCVLTILMKSVTTVTPPSLR